MLVSGCAVAAQTAPARPPLVSAEIAASIEEGLDYLVRTQNRDGSWRGSGGYGVYPTAMTALAGMAVIGSGSTPTRGPHWRTVRRATDFLMSTAQPSGLLTAPVEESRSMYGHGFATMFLAQVYGMEEDRERQERLHRLLRRAVELIARSQSTYGGWYYTPDSGSDEGSVTVTQLQALRACRNAGVAVPAETIKAAVKYIRDSANPDGGIRYAARQGGNSRAAITAAAVAVLYWAGKYDDDMAERALTYALRALPVRGGGRGHHYYGHLYLAQACWQKGGAVWTEHYPKIGGWLLGQQRDDGSWQGDGVGTIYGTAIALTILQLPFDLVPIYQR
ncbi:MAG: prenyltransferase/squalene oxidase repeat-containing protein [Planctomycetota bacterium]